MDNSTKSSWQLLTLNQSLVDSIDGITLKQQDFHQQLKKKKLNPLQIGLHVFSFPNTHSLHCLWYSYEIIAGQVLCCLYAH